MPRSQQHVDDNTPMGATLVDGGATFRVWAPAAHSVHVVTDALAATRTMGFVPDDEDALVRRADDTWAGYVPGLVEGSPYRFWVTGDDGAGLKRDPYARQLGTVPAFPDCDCIVRRSDGYPWHDAGFRPPAFRDLVIYQLHVGTFWGADAQGRDRRERRVSKFLDLVWRLQYLSDLGV